MVRMPPRVRSSLSRLALEDEQLLLREAGTGHVVEVELLELLEAGEPLGDRLEVGEHATEPAVVDVGHADAGRLLGDRLLRLALGADEEDGAAVGDGLPDELVRVVDVGQRLLQVDDVDAVALGHDEALHLGVPATGLVPEVDAALEELAHGDDGHRRSPCSVVVSYVGGAPRLLEGRHPPAWCPATPRTDAPEGAIRHCRGVPCAAREGSQRRTREFDRPRPVVCPFYGGAAPPA